jgi:hypothetical protein
MNTRLIPCAAPCTGSSRRAGSGGNTEVESAAPLFLDANALDRCGDAFQPARFAKHANQATCANRLSTQTRRR